MQNTEEASEKELARKVQLMDKANAFFNTDLGREIMKRVDNEIDEALEALKDMDPENAKEIRKAQNQVYRAERLKIWINEIILEGLNVLEIVELSDDE